MEWTSAEPYRGVRRLATAGGSLYVCDTKGHVVDQLDARSGKRLARLGVMGEPGPSLNGLDTPYAVAADLGAVYVADNGNGRIVVATTTLWRPDIRRLPREEAAPIVAARVPVEPPASGRISVNVFDENDLTVRQLACAQPSGEPVLWDGRDYLGRWVQSGRYRYHGIVAPKLGLRYVASVGQPRHQVVYFDRQGRETHALGRRGGRPQCGSMRDPALRQSFRKPVGLCVTAQGRLFVAENAAPKRFMRWSARGELEREFHGPYYFSGMFGVDDQQPEFIYADTHADLIRYRLDYQTGQWAVDRVWVFRSTASGTCASCSPRRATRRPRPG